MIALSSPTWAADWISVVSTCETTDRMSDAEVVCVTCVVVGSVGEGVCAGDVTGAEVAAATATLDLWSEPEDFAQTAPATPTTTRPTMVPARIARLRFGDGVEPCGGNEEVGSDATAGGVDGAIARSAPQFTQNLVAESIGSPQLTQNPLVFVWLIRRSPHSWSMPATTR